METNAYFPKPNRFAVFKMMYINEAKRRHHDNSHWQTYAQVLENLGGDSALYDIWSLFGNITNEQQQKVLGFTDADITAFLERDDAGREYALATLE